MGRILTIKIRIDDDVMSNTDEVVEAVNQALDGAQLDNNESGPILDSVDRPCGAWRVE